MTSTRMRLAVLTMTLVILLKGYAQTLSIAAETQTVISYRALVLNNQNAQGYKNYRNNIESYAIRQGFGFLVQKKINAKYDLSMGVHYTDQAIKADYSIRFEDLIDPNKGFTNPTQEPIEGNFFTSFKYLEIPILFCFKINRDKIQLRLGAGLVPKYLIKATNTNFFHDNLELENFRSFNLGFTGRMGYFYNLKEQLQIGVNLIAQPDLIAINASPNKEFLYSFRFGIGCIYQVKQK